MVDDGEFDELIKHFKIPNLNANKPVLRFYPNGVSGDAKVEAAHNLKFDRLDSNIGPIIDEIHDSFEHNVQKVVSVDVDDMIKEYAAEKQQNVVLHVHKDERVSLAYKALSKHQIFHNCVFFSVQFPKTGFQGLR